MKRVYIHGIRGIPASHGGFETFAEYLAPYLVKQGWAVSVFCQVESGDETNGPEQWNGVDLIKVAAPGVGALSTVVFDLKTILYCINKPGVNLVLGYNTAIFCALLRLFNRKTIINMDGIEWKRDKWGVAAKTWFYINEFFGNLFGHHLIADHPEIKRHLTRHIRWKKISTIPYGSERIETERMDPSLISLGLEKNRYFVVIARPEPENSILEIVKAHTRAQTDSKLVVLGRFDFANNAYHRAVQEAAGDQVLFPGAIYVKSIVRSLRANCLAYIHGHTVGGTNPSLVEALGAGNPVIAHDNPFNRWVARESALYFSDEGSLVGAFKTVASNTALVNSMRAAAVEQHRSRFEWDLILNQYAVMLEKVNAGQFTPLRSPQPAIHALPKREGNVG